jgi:hypothetical protein
MTNEEKANEIARDMLPYNNAEYHACYNSAMKAMKWKEKQLIDKAMKVICNGCAQKAECEFKNWKTCTTRDELIKSIEE